MLTVKDSKQYRNKVKNESFRPHPILQSSSPQPLWHHGLVSWKTIFPRTGRAVDRMVSGRFKCITFELTCCVAQFLTGPD